MAQATILRRERVLRVPAGREAAEVVEVAYSTVTTLPRTVRLSLDLYRPATPDELNANPRYQMLPVSEQAAAAEREAIQTDWKTQADSVPDMYDMP